MQICELVHEKYTGKSIIRQTSRSSLQSLRGEPARPVSALSISSYPNEENHQQRLLESSLSPLGPSSSSLVDGSVKMTSQTLTPLREEAESMPGESAHKKTSYDVVQASSKFDDDQHKFDRSEVRRPSILKLPPGINSSLEERRGSQHHVQFTESQKAT